MIKQAIEKSECRGNEEAKAVFTRAPPSDSVSRVLAVHRNAPRAPSAPCLFGEPSSFTSRLPFALCAQAALPFFNGVGHSSWSFDTPVSYAERNLSFYHQFYVHLNTAMGQWVAVLDCKKIFSLPTYKDDASSLMYAFSVLFFFAKLYFIHRKATWQSCYCFCCYYGGIFLSSKICATVRKNNCL